MSKRTESLRQTLPNERGVLLSSPENERYFLEFELADSYVFIAKENAYIITDFRYLETAAANSGNNFKVVDIKDKNCFADILKENGISEVLYEDRHLSVNEFHHLREIMPNAEFIPLDRTLEKIRQKKDKKELDFIIKAQRIAEKSFDELLNRIDFNMTETELASELEYLMKKNGSRNPSFDTIAISGSATSLPHGIPRDKKLEKGFVTIDFGAICNGYHSDMTRTFCIGKADDEMKKVYSAVITAQNLAIEAMENGERNCVEIDRIARDYIYESGYRGMFGHGLGHGVGLQIHELPRLSPSFPEDEVLSDGDVFSVEPGIYIPKKYGVRIEDLVYVDGNSIKNMTLTPKNLIEL